MHSSSVDRLLRIFSLQLHILTPCPCFQHKLRQHAHRIPANSCQTGWGCPWVAIYLSVRGLLLQDVVSRSAVWLFETRGAWQVSQVVCQHCWAPINSPCLIMTVNTQFHPYPAIADSSRHLSQDSCNDESSSTTGTAPVAGLKAGMRRGREW